MNTIPPSVAAPVATPPVASAVVTRYNKLYPLYGSSVIPVIPAGATLQQPTSLREDNLGKIPGGCANPATNLWHGIRNWQMQFNNTTQAHVQQWQTWPEHAVGVLATYYPGVDIDINDPALVDQVYATLMEVLPATAVRRREGSPRLMLSYQLPHGYISDPKGVVTLPESKGMVEFLGFKNFYVVEGPHKNGAMQTVTGEPAVVTVMQLRAAQELLVERFGAACSKVGKNRTGQEVIAPESLAQTFTFQMMAKHGLQGDDQENGFVYVDCPNQAEHEVDDGRHGVSLIDGSYKCFHSTCEKLDQGSLEFYLREQYQKEYIAFLFGEVKEAELVHIPTQRDKLQALQGRAQLLDSEDIDARAQLFLDVKSSGLLATEVGIVLKEIAKSGGYTIPDVKSAYKETTMGGGSGTAISGELLPFGSEDNVAKEYIFVENQNKYLNTLTKAIVSPSAFDRQYDQLGPDGKSEMPAKNVFRVSGGIFAKDIIWSPWPYGAGTQLLIDQDGTGQNLKVNYYREPKLIQATNADSLIEPWLELAEYLIPNEAERNILFDHMAFTLQHPEVKIQWQILWIGELRTGKDGVLAPLVKFLGDNASEIGQSEIKDDWGDNRVAKKLLVYQEVKKPGDRDFENMLKTQAAGTASGNSRLNIKGGGVIEQPNLYSIVGMSNYTNCMHLHPRDGRWFAISSMGIYPKYGEGTKKSKQYYADYFNWVNTGGGVDAVCSWLLGRDLTDFQHGALPWRTEAYMEISNASRSNLMDFLAYRLEQEYAPFHNELFEANAVITHLRAESYNGKYGTGSVSEILKDLGCVKLKQAQKMIDKVPKFARLYSREANPQIEALSPSDLYDLYQRQGKGEKVSDMLEAGFPK